MKHKGQQAALRLQLGPAYEDNDLVFPEDDGTVWNPETFSRAFTRLIARAGLPKVRFHDLRHSHVAQLIEKDVQPKEISERLGHSTIAITMDLYGHVFQHAPDEIAVRWTRSCETRSATVRQASHQNSVTIM